MASKDGQLNALDEENDRLIREREEKEGGDQVCRYLPDIYGISVY
jgi:hypothetical protein